MVTPSTARANNVVTVLFSINSSYNSPAAARDVTDHIWNAFLGGARRGVRRPFGVDAVPDGGAEQERFSDLGGAACRRSTATMAAVARRSG